MGKKFPILENLYCLIMIRETAETKFEGNSRNRALLIVYLLAV